MYIPEHLAPYSGHTDPLIPAMLTTSGVIKKLTFWQC
jgi:hypothetical protein